MNFVKSSGLESQSSNNVSWTSNPIYRSPESAGVSWYDQATHWDPASEGIFSISQGSTNNPIPYWTNNDKNLSGIRNEWTKSEAQVASNSQSQITPQSQPSTSGLQAAASPVVTPESQATDRLSSAKTASKVATGITTVGNVLTGAASLTGPIGVAAAINSALGAATASAINSGNQATIVSDFAYNSKAQGTNAGHQAALIRDLDTAHASITNSGAQIGGIAGPLGAWFGSLIANAIQDSGPKDNYSDLKTSFGFGGRYNPQDTGAVNTHTTADLSGETNLISNV